VTVEANLAASFAAFEFAGMLRAATWASGGSSVAGQVIFDAPGALPVEGVYSNEYSIVYRVSQWPTVREGDVVTVGTAYRVREVTAIDDGLLARAFLTKRS
jgi:hypothetical protein